MMILRTSCASSCCSFSRVSAFLQIGNVRAGEGAGDLAIQVDPIHHDQHGGILQAGMHAQLLRGKHHQQ
jgi:hypothetical protein